MGKSNRKERNKDRPNPIAKPVKPLSDPELVAIRDKQILPIINDLESPDTKRRAAAASAVANIIEDTKCRKLLLREQIVRILLEQTITDSALESKSAGWGILRNLALEEEADFCIHLYRQDILTAVHSIVQTIIETLESEEHPVSKLPKTQQQLVWSLSSSIIALIGSLAEAQEEIVTAITMIPAITKFIFGLLSFDSVPIALFGDALSCLATLTEENEPLAKQIIDNDFWLKGLMQLRELGGSRAVAACGVLHNIFSTLQWFDHNTPVEGASDAMLIPTLVECVVKAQEQGVVSNGSSNSSPDQVLQLALEITASIATTLQEALEHGNRNEKEFEGFGDVDGADEMMVEDDASDVGKEHENDDEGEEDDHDDEMDEDELEADMALVTGPDVGDSEYADEQPTLDALIRTATPAVLLLARPSLDESPERSTMRDSALSTLNNIAWTVSSIDFATSSSSLSKTWSALAQHIWKEAVSPVLTSNTADIALASSITSLAWAVTRSVQGQVTLQADEQRKFMALYQASKGLDATTNDKDKAADQSRGDAFQGLGVKCIGVLGRLALSPAPIELNREIGIFLLTVLAGLPTTPAADAVEALNQLFDIYADKEYDCDEAVFWKDDFYKHLEAIKPLAKKMAKGIDKRKETELRDRADEVVLNLDRFMKYKRSERNN